ncbi:MULTISPECIES: ATP-binding cassette domain-containing protein [unclassified Curtobacterium]|uniref:ATP-binding cassette domain-containing protein n=1 Tax=unclassified Curtobacterium TaxID=257496 RepID=UPI0021ACDD9E|nr:MULTISPECIES: ATP-binding cassette domain-containing protein [unclassified Curtobacterium]WIB70292.1 ATP-binding cassette domain-containing protein [Curtobacterium sp. MCBD17_026]
MTDPIELRRVGKTYGKRIALDDVSFSCPEGTITAFCGPNGAGKSTALKILTGITRADVGAAFVNGQELQQLSDPARFLGCLLDASAFHPGRSVRETLRLTAFTIGEPFQRVDQCLEMVGLSEVAARRVGKLSLGMRQRLGLAHALLGHPRALVLDEPSNGLDPEGMRWLDNLLLHFAEQGGTVLVSTHQLAAVERTADRLVVISRGRIVDETRLDDLRTQAGRTFVVAEDLPRFEEALRRVGSHPFPTGAGLLVDLAPEEVGRAARDARIALLELRSENIRLDAYLASLTATEYEGRMV